MIDVRGKNYGTRPTAAEIQRFMHNMFIDKTFHGRSQDGCWRGFTVWFGLIKAGIYTSIYVFVFKSIFVTDSLPLYEEAG